MTKSKNLFYAIILFSVTIVFNVLAELNIGNNLLKYLDTIWAILPALGIYFTFKVDQDPSVKLWIKIILNLIAFIYLLGIIFLIFGLIVFDWLNLI